MMSMMKTTITIMMITKLTRKMMVMIVAKEHHKWINRMWEKDKNSE